MEHRTRSVIEKGQDFTNKFSIYLFRVGERLLKVWEREKEELKAGGLEIDKGFFANLKIEE